jgi:hypothetical protein
MPANQIRQNGSVTPGHIVTWVTDGVVQDGGPFALSQKVLAHALQADFNSTFDQPLLITPSVKALQLTGIIVTNSSINLTTAVGGFYPQALRGGSPLVAAAQVYSALTDADQLLNPTLTAFAQDTRLSLSNLGHLPGDTSGSLVIYFNLTTPQGAIANADIYLLGIDLTP